MKQHTIRKIADSDLDLIFNIINASALKYRGVIPPDCWHEPYMPLAELQQEIKAGVDFCCHEEAGRISAVMGIQDVMDVTLIRHAYVLPDKQRRGIGGMLLSHLLTIAEQPVLVGTWAAAGWAIGFYEKHGFRRVSESEKERLLKKYWNIPERQVETSVVLAK